LVRTFDLEFILMANDGTVLAQISGRPTR